MLYVLTIPNIVRGIKSTKLTWAGHLVTTEEGRSAFNMLVGKSTGKRPLGMSIGYLGRQYYSKS